MDAIIKRFRVRKPSRGQVDTYYSVLSRMPLGRPEIEALRSAGKLGHGQSYGILARPRMLDDDLEGPEGYDHRTYVVDYSDSSD